MNRGSGQFIEAGGALGLGGLPDARGMALADFDHDGDVDIVVNNYKAQVSYYENRMSDKPSSVFIRLQGTSANRDAVGAQISAFAGDNRILRLVGNHSYSGQSSLEQHFGLGNASTLTKVQVRWPDGSEESFGDLGAGSRVQIIQGQGVSISQAPVPQLAKPESERSTWPYVGLAVLIFGVGVLRWKSS